MALADKINKSVQDPAGINTPTPAQEAYVLYDGLCRGLALVDMVSEDVLLELKDMLTKHRWCEEGEREVVLTMLDYVNSQLVTDKMKKAAKGETK